MVELVPRQVSALVLKNLVLQKRQRRMVCCQVCSSLLILIFIGLLQIIVNNALSSSVGKVDYHDSTPQNNTRYVDSFAYTAVNTSFIGTLTQNCTSSGLLANLPQGFYFGGTCGPYGIPIPLSDGASSEFVLNSYLMNMERTLRPWYDNNYVRLAFSFSSQSLDESTFNYTVAAYNNSANWNRAPAINAINNAILQTATSNQYQIAGQQQAMPFSVTQASVSIADALGIFFFPLIFMLPLPMLSYTIVLEKQLKLREMMKLMGLKAKKYFFVNYFFTFALYCGTLLIFTIAGFAFKIRFITQTDGAILALLFFGSAAAMTGTVMLFGAIFSRTLVSTVVGFLLSILGTILAFILDALIFAKKRDYDVVNIIMPFPVVLTIFDISASCASFSCPTFSSITPGGNNNVLRIALSYLWAVAIIYPILAAYLNQVLPQEYGVPKHPLFFLSFMKPLFGTLFENSTASPDGSGASSTKPASKRQQSAAESTALMEKGHNSVDPLEEEDVIEKQEKEEEDLLEDEDVKALKQKILQRQYNPQSPIIVEGLRKEYGADKIAIKNLYLELGTELFGFLGPNGAGKTTTISILCGLFSPTSGTARVNGYDIRTDMDKVHLSMGLCPQFDCCWEDLSCKEHLLFYARLKGVPASEEDDHVNTILTNVGLDSSADRLSSALSGGMRRRLSVAIAFVGNPAVVFMDEPSTGLDPSSRRQLWDVITANKAGKCIVLTTHSLEEAEVLCGRVGIMASGRLRCIGTPMHLKNRYGAGLKLQCSFIKGQEARALAFVQRICPNANLVSTMQSTRTFEIPRNDVRMSTIFAAMEAGKEQNGIRDFLLTQASLEDAFLSIVAEEEKAAAGR